MKKHCVALVSGGLDSILAVRVLLEEGVKVNGLHITHPWEPRTSSDITFSIGKLGIPLKEVHLAEEFIETIRNPIFGHGKHINPCIDCKILMLKKAKEYMHEIRASFISTGEVIGQRPMSQMRRTLEIIEKRAGLEGILLRPLSARCLEPTMMEKEGVIDRKRLFNISGRSRKEQLLLAQRFGITHYRTPAGGCLLTHKEFAHRIRDLWENEDAELAQWQLRLLKIGRHFRIDKDVKIVLGRNESENNKLEGFKEHVAEWIIPEFSGPSCAIVGKTSNDISKMALDLICLYTSKKNWDKIDAAQFITQEGIISVDKDKINFKDARRIRKKCIV